MHGQWTSIKREKRTEHEALPNTQERKLAKVLQYLSLKHDDPIQFLLCEWQKEKHPHKWYIVYRWLQAVYFVATFIYTIWDYEFPEKYFIYWTNWGYLFCVIQSIWSLTLIMIYWSSQRQNKAYMGYRFFHIVALDLAHIICIMYWAFVHEKSDGYPVSGLIVHAFNLVVMLLDFALVANPINLLYVVYPVIVGLVYTSFNFCYYLAGGTGTEGQPYIYKVVDWRKPGPSAGMTMASIALAIVIHVLVWGLDKLKKCAHSKGSTENLV